MIPAAARRRIARAVLGWVERVAPEVVAERVRERSAGVVVEAVKAMMDHQGLSRCRECPQRTGLRKVGGALLCAVHGADQKDGGKCG